MAAVGRRPTQPSLSAIGPGPGSDWVPWRGKYSSSPRKMPDQGAAALPQLVNPHRPLPLPVYDPVQQASSSLIIYTSLY